MIFSQDSDFSKFDPNFLGRFRELSWNLLGFSSSFLKSSENVDADTYPDHLITPNIEKVVAILKFTLETDIFRLQKYY